MVSSTSCWSIEPTYFQRQTAEEDEIRKLADALYRKADWQWMQNGEAAVSHGWTPEKGFLPYRWKGYDEALIIYLPVFLALYQGLPRADA